ncbi:hypothetical protein DFJ67_7921 [Asanoa ferruginea]|uniref:Uncharacterized protein n=1 Tax=Asanoa ferruginea TaxID=53367 RepID=A0A3D9ZXH6_9ACTN|nr:hypothetical protein DFJ67_7921 [Asanoa ferruginea]
MGPASRSPLTASRRSAAESERALSGRWESPRKVSSPPLAESERSPRDGRSPLPPRGGSPAALWPRAGSAAAERSAVDRAAPAVGVAGLREPAPREPERLQAEASGSAAGPPAASGPRSQPMRPEPAPEAGRRDCCSSGRSPDTPGARSRSVGRRSSGLARDFAPAACDTGRCWSSPRPRRHQRRPLRSGMIGRTTGVSAPAGRSEPERPTGASPRSRRPIGAPAAAPRSRWPGISAAAPRSR